MKKLKLFGLFLLTCVVANAQKPYTQEIRDIVDFENNLKVIEYIKLDTSNGDIWRIGKPDKPKLYSAYSGTNVIVTDLKKPYPPNIHSSFIMKFFNKYKVPDGLNYKIGIQGFYQIESDSLNDYGIIEMSYDNGSHWLNLLDGVVHYGNWYLDGEENKPVFSGNFLDKWHLFSFVSNWNYALAAYDTLWFRFTFISDSINNIKQGWIIDDIEINIYPPVSINDSPQNNDLITITPNPVKQTNNFTITLNGIYTKLINIYNSQGRLLLQINNPRESVTINTTQFQKGLYLVEIIDIKNKRMKNKFVIN